MNAVAEVLSQVGGWPPDRRLTLAQEILRTLEGDVGASPAGKKSLRDLLGLLRTNGAPISDEECRRLLEDELLGKYAT